jgi:hypothetical protein
VPEVIALLITAIACLPMAFAGDKPEPVTSPGREVAISRHPADGEEFKLCLPDLFDFGKKLFNANRTEQEGGRRPLRKVQEDRFPILIAR